MKNAIIQDYVEIILTGLVSLIIRLIKILLLIIYIILVSFMRKSQMSFITIQKFYDILN